MPDDLQIAIKEVDHDFRKIRIKVSEDPEFELGDDPTFVEDIFQQLIDIEKKFINRIGVVYLLPQRMPSENNLYYAVLNNLRKARDFISNVRRQNIGSQNNTYEFLDRIRACIESFNELSVNAEIPIFPYEYSLDVLRKRLSVLNSDHPAFGHYAILREKLEQAWQTGQEENAPTRKSILAEFDALSQSVSGLTLGQLERQSLESNADNLVIPPFEEPLPIENYWAIVVGVGKHDHKDIYGNLPQSTKDACEFAEILLSAYDPSHLQILVNSIENNSSELENIKIPTWDELLNTLRYYPAQAKENDLLLFYFSGHGVLFEGDPYLILQDTNSYIDRTGIKMSVVKNAIKSSKARVKIIILDTCHAGGILSSAKSGDNIAKEKYIRLILEGGEGTFIMTSCKEGEFSFPHDESGMSVFSYYLTKGLKGGNRRERKFITVSDLKSYVENGVTVWSHESKKPQTPLFQFEKNFGDPIVIDWRSQQEEADGHDLV